MCGICGCGGTAALHTARYSGHVHDTRMIEVEKDILHKNDEYAAHNRKAFVANGTLAINLLSSPGSGKTSLLVQTIRALKRNYQFAVIEGDQQSNLDSERVRATGVPAVQINTGKACHLDAHAVGHALEELPRGGILFIENVGNLVCPAAFDLGEKYRVVILSVTEGEDKPIKYPEMFYTADIVLLNKCDLLPYLDFDMDKCLANLSRTNPEAGIFPVSAKTGEGMADWYAWLMQRVH